MNLPEKLKSFSRITYVALVILFLAASAAYGDGEAPGLEENISEQSERNQLLKEKSPIKVEEVQWEGDSCGCGPEPQDTPYINYGFFRLWEAKVPNKIDFSILNRIGYFSLTPDARGYFGDRKKTFGGNDEFLKSPHRYRTKVDLVVSYYDWPTYSDGENASDDEGKLDLMKDYILYELAGNIINTIEKYHMDGVTIDFGGIPKDLTGRFHLFIHTLSKYLRTKGKEEHKKYPLNVVIPYDADDKDPLGFETVKKLKGYVKYFLVMGKIGAASDDDPKEPLEKFAEASDMAIAEIESQVEALNEKLKASILNYTLKVEAEVGDRQTRMIHMFKEPGAAEAGSGDESETPCDSPMDIIAKKFSKLEISDKLVPVLSTKEGADFETQYEKIIKTYRVGGMGMWPLIHEKGSIQHQAVTKMFQSDPKNADFIKQIIAKYVPGLCSMICPNRVLISIVLSVIAALFFTFLLLSAFYCPLRAIIRKYTLCFLAMGVSLFLAFQALCLCYPPWQKHSSEITLGMFAAIIAYAAWDSHKKKNKGKLP